MNCNGNRWAEHYGSHKILIDRLMSRLYANGHWQFNSQPTITLFRNRNDRKIKPTATNKNNAGSKLRRYRRYTWSEIARKLDARCLKEYASGVLELSPSRRVTRRANTLGIIAINHLTLPVLRATDNRVRPHRAIANLNKF